MNKVIAYVGTKDLEAILETDILKIDVINIAFGHINNNIIRRCNEQPIIASPCWVLCNQGTRF